MWNNNEHQVAYGAVPSMGAVLHTLNLRLSPEQAVYIIKHADDKGDHRRRVDRADARPVRQGHAEREARHRRERAGECLRGPEGITVHSFDELIAGEPTVYDWPEIDERDAAVMCYTSGTTGDPKGVVYSHRSIWLHSMQVCSASGMGLGNKDSVLAIVPMFHVMSWGLPHAAMMAGLTLVMPDRFLQPEPLLAMMAAARPTFAAAVPTIWRGVAAQLKAAPQDISHLREVVVGGAAVPRR